jgi:hypothetical protein
LKTYVFIERSRLGKVFYEVRGKQILISGRRALQPFRLEFELSELSNRVERLSRRFYRPIARLFAYAAVFTTTVILFLIQKAVPIGAVIYLAEIAGFWAVMFILAGIRWLPRLEVVRFRNTLGKITFDVIKEPSYAADFEDFVDRLRYSIKTSLTPNESTDPAPSSGRSRAEHETRHR